MFQLSPLPAARFAHLYGKADAELSAAGVTPRIADSKPGFPCRVTLRDAEPGERLLLLNYEHQSAATPYRSSHAIYVIDGAEETHLKPGEIPEQLRSRMLSIRAFSREGMIVDADIADGREAAATFERMLANPDADYLHVHFAKFGCYAARVDRAG